MLIVEMWTNKESEMRINYTLSYILGLALSGFLYSASVYCQPVDKEQVLKKSETEKTEVISVRGQKPLGFYRQEMVELKFEFFDMLNALNTKPEFAIKCEKKSSIESRVKQTVCEPQYVIEMRAKLNQQKRQGSQFTGAALTQTSDRELNQNLQEWHEKADQEKLRLIANNPTLKEHFLKLIKSERAFKRLHAETYGSMSNYYQEVVDNEKVSEP